MRLLFAIALVVLALLLVAFLLLVRPGTVKLTDAETITRAQHVSSQQRFSYAAVSVAVISRQICHLWAISWR
jgi:hypothetical protein